MNGAVILRSKTYKNIVDSGYTTYHSDGSKSVTYENMLDNGVTTYHSDGSKSVTYQNMTNNGYTTYHSKSVSSQGNPLSNVGYAVGGFSVLAVCVICSFVVLKYSSILPIGIIIASYLIALPMGRIIGESNAFLITQPFFFYGIQHFVALAWTKHGDVDFLVGVYGVLGGIVLEVVLELYIIVSKIGDEDDYGNNNAILLICDVYLAIFAPASVFIGESAFTGFILSEVAILSLTILFVLVRCVFKRKKH